MFSAKQLKQGVGKLGEEKACEFLKSNGYLIIERNYQKPWGEIDIIAITPDKTLVFFEVKTMRQFDGNRADSLWPEDNLSESKLKKIRRSAQMFSAKHSDLIHEEKGWRIDLLALTLQQNSELPWPETWDPKVTSSELNKLTINNESCIIKHYQNI